MLALCRCGPAGVERFAADIKPDDDEAAAGAAAAEAAAAAAAGGGSTAADAAGDVRKRARLSDASTALNVAAPGYSAWPGTAAAAGEQQQQQQAIGQALGQVVELPSAADVTPFADQNFLLHPDSLQQGQQLQAQQHQQQAWQAHAQAQQQQHQQLAATQSWEALHHQMQQHMHVHQQQGHTLAASSGDYTQQLAPTGSMPGAAAVAAAAAAAAAAGVPPGDGGNVAWCPPAAGL